LPSHPFYGLKITIIQRGKTDSQEWCLIKHPGQVGFHYRIPSRWLEQKAPAKIQLLPYQKNEIALPFKQLQKLAFFVQCKLSPALASSFDPNIVGSLQQTIAKPGLNVLEKREGNSNNLVQSSSSTKNKDRVEAVMDNPIPKSTEQAP
jgi:hypothetical protein